MPQVKTERGDLSDADEQQQPRKRQARGATKLTPALYKAEVKLLAQTGPATRDPSSKAVDGKDLERIQKCLQRANHPNTPEAEAKAAFHVASQLMSRHNVTQAEVLAHTAPDEQAKFAGQSEVAIKRADGSSKSVNQQIWVSTLAQAMELFFDCKHYSTGMIASINWTFYGIAANTVAAAMAFEMAYNLIMDWAKLRKGVGPKNSYCIGAAVELRRMARKEKEDEERKATETEQEATASSVRQEDAQRQEELKRLEYASNMSDTTSSDSSAAEEYFGFASLGEDTDEDEALDDVAPDFKVDADSDQISLFGDIDEEIMKRVKAEPAPSEHGVDDIESAEANGTESGWASSMQLTKFRATAGRIADDYLQDTGVKVRTRKEREFQIRDWAAYKEGSRDGKTIDVRRKRIES